MLLRAVVALGVKDLRCVWRTRTALVAAATVGAVGLVLASMAAGPDTDRLRQLAPALTWLVLLFSTVGLAERLDRLEREDDAFSAVWLLVPDHRAIFLGKIIAAALLLTVLATALWSLSLVLLDVSIGPGLLGVALVIPMGAFAAAVASMLAVSLVADVPERTLLLPVLLLPLLVPTLLASVEASDAALTGQADVALRWAALLVVQSLLMLGAGLLTYEAAAAPS